MKTISVKRGIPAVQEVVPPQADTIPGVLPTELVGLKVQNIEGDNGPVRNQFLIRGHGWVAFQSYDSVIAVEHNGAVYLDERHWDYSKTTGRYRNLFLNENKKDTERKIANGTYTLANLNP